LPPLAPSKDLPVLPETYIRIIGAEAYAFHQEMLKAHPDRYNAGTRKSIEGGAATSAADYIRARQEMQRLRAESARLFSDADLLITPTAPGAAFEFGERRLVFLRNTAPWNLLGLPSISIPCGFTTGRLPIGLQITGAAGRDDAVLALAAAYQKTTDWHTRRPAGV
jgi:aspartyl-tRNA(Asn)/glutamyl-tRNA(Gln) amidotransferase subunit A